MKLTALVLAALGFSVLSWWFLPGPFLWIALAWALCLALIAKWARVRPVRGFCVSLTILALALAGAEALLWRRAVRDRVPECTQEAEYPQGYFEPFHEVLGYGPRPGSTTHSRKLCSGELIYDVEYTIDARGLRVSPPSAAEEGVVFFGGSFMFGEGVRDEEALPYQFGLRTAERLRVDNFGFQGYGPHQMLRALETGYVEELVPGRPVAFLYLMIVLHVRRSAGMEPWDEHGPRYVLKEDGGVEYTGRFSDFASRPGLAWLLDRSYLWQRLHARTSDADLELCVAIVDGARREVQQRFPGASFHVLLWDETRSTSDELEEGLRARGVELLRVSDIQLKEELKKLTGKEVQLNIFEIKRPELDAFLVASSVARQIENRISYRRAIKMAIAAAIRMNAEGIKIEISGRLNGAEMARTEHYKEGRIPLSTFRADIDYALVEAHTTYGRLGIKVWIMKGEVYGKRELSPLVGLSKNKGKSGGRDNKRRRK